MLSVSKTAVKFINSSARMSLDWHFCRVSHICTPRIAIRSQLVFRAMCELIRQNTHKPKCPHLYHSFKYALEDNPSPFYLNWLPCLTPSMFLLYYITSSGKTTCCIYQPLPLDASVIPVFLKILINNCVLDSFHLVDTRWKRLLCSLIYVPLSEPFVNFDRLSSPGGNVMLFLQVPTPIRFISLPIIAKISGQA